MSHTSTTFSRAELFPTHIPRFFCENVPWGCFDCAEFCCLEESCDAGKSNKYVGCASFVRVSAALVELLSTGSSPTARPNLVRKCIARMLLGLYVMKIFLRSADARVPH